MRFYRFELAFDGEPQGVGFLQGLDDVGFTMAKKERLMQPFNEHLAIPDVESDDDSAVVFFFTEQGLMRFAKDLNRIIKAIEPRGWSLIATAMEEDDFSNALYSDECQAAWSRTYLGCYSNFAEIRAAEDVLNMVPQPA